MELKQLTDNWKCLGALVGVAVILCGTAIGVDQRYLLAAQGQQMQQQIYQMQLSQNYNNFQMRLDSLRAAYAGKPIPQEVQAQIRWLEAQIALLEKQMGK